ncbi:MAG: rhodanese-like domain-containing protein, partial [Planctomycetota bacterium]
MSANDARDPGAGPQLAALAVMVLAVAAALAIGKATTATAVGEAPATIGPDDLARELLAAPNDVLVVDVRTPEQFATWHLPGAVNMAADGGISMPAGPFRLVVLAGDGRPASSQVLTDLQRASPAPVRVLTGGLPAFAERVLLPPSLRQGLDESACKQALPGWHLARAFFLASPAPSPHAVWATDPEQLTRPTMVSPRWLHDRIGKIAVLDTRPERDFLALHVPGAQRLDLARIRTKHGDRDLHLAANDALASWFGNLGIGADTPVVLYTNDRPQDCTMAALALLRLGHRALAILEGGVLRWAAERRPLTAELTMPVAVTYVPRPSADDFTITTDALAAAVAAGSTKVLDVRPADFFRGDKSTEARPGHIPGAKNRDH